MPFVLDASIAACWAFMDEGHPLADATLTRLRTDRALVPALWWFEIRNVLIMSERRGRIVETDSAAFLANLQHLDITSDHTPEEGNVMALARQHRLTIYDAAYLELAQRLHLPLATHDSALAKAAAACEVTLFS